MITQRTFTVIHQCFPETKKAEQHFVYGLEDFAVEELITFHKFLGNYIYKQSLERSTLIHQINADKTKERNVH